MVKAAGNKRRSMGSLEHTETKRPKTSARPQSLYKRIIGKEVWVPASEFGIEVPELFYKARIVKKDPSHSRAVVVKFPDDGNLCWLPVDRVCSWLKDMEQFGWSGSTVGEAASVYAARVLTGFSRGADSCEAVVPGTPSTPSQEPDCGCQDSPCVASLLLGRTSSECSTKTGASAWSDGEQCSMGPDNLRVGHRRKPPAATNRRTV